MMQGLAHAVTLAEWHSDFWTPGWPEIVVGILYVAVSLRALALLANFASEPRDRLTWRLITCTVMAVSCGVLAGVPDYVTRVIRAWVFLSGWYDERWPYQLGIVVGICACAVIGGAGLQSACTGAQSFHGVIFWLLLLATFVLMRAVSLHEIDAFLQMSVCGDLSVSRLMEGTLLLALLSAMRGLRDVAISDDNPHLCFDRKT